MMDGMRMEPLGEDAWIVRDLPGEAWRYVASAEALPGVIEAAACFDSLGLWIEESFNPVLLDHLKAAEIDEPRTIVVPTIYDGPDLGEVARLLGLSEEGVVALHASESYRCGAVGFQPGFPYLRPLPAPLDALPRRTSPRPRVPAGSVAIAAGMTGIYPGESPGGWWLIGRTELPLVSGDRTLFRAGDIARFVPITGR
ncbi:carboxyltransferase domain-containing protein [bacterium]|nr:MAG: carboxyltransferase domain-containing protein [bacterium]